MPSGRAGAAWVQLSIAHVCEPPRASSEDADEAAAIGHAGGVSDATFGGMTRRPTRPTSRATGGDGVLVCGRLLSRVIVGT
mmetsp:Transcript_1603/g.4200  ORF Transcript_1603/g.4200 Transcript_1603/m.4200 type:complete len:81 (-) Transcript_1603:189-431(-)